jgi:hypothetical protein
MAPPHQGDKRQGKEPRKGPPGLRLEDIYFIRPDVNLKFMSPETILTMV